MRLALGAIASLLAVACDTQQTSDVEPAASAAASMAATSNSASPSSATEASTAAPAAATRPPKPFAESPAARLGQLPEGLGIAVGESAPDGTVQDDDGNKVTLSSLWSKGPVMLVFYRGGWCPYCNFQIRGLTKDFDAYRAKGVTPVAVSVDTADEASKTTKLYDIPFPVLSDPELVLHEAFHVVNEMPKEQVEALREHGMDLEKSSGKGHHKIAIPSIFIIDEKGIVRWAHADPEYKVRPTKEQLLSAIAEAIPAK